MNRNKLPEVDMCDVFLDIAACLPTKHPLPLVREAPVTLLLSSTDSDFVRSFSHVFTHRQPIIILALTYLKLSLLTVIKRQ